ncbi:acyltransferase family protein [Streptomyces sp. MMBL 11-3]|uniref:acyltransferase family protein n=1 Tax=Streptomyces sp. MMBL 11-3 TaxID=3382639 RepID=UPI0039B44897
MSTSLNRPSPAPPASTASGTEGSAGPLPERSGRSFEPAVDGLRAIATLMVVTAHLAQWTGALIDKSGRPGPLAPVLSGFVVAIPIFLIISGYLLYRPWADAALGGDRPPRTLPYYWHRVLRIFPAYWLFMVTALLVFDRERLDDGWRILRLLTVQHVQHWADLRSDPGATNWAQTWSLATEVHYYIALPVVAYVLHRLLRAAKGIAPAVALLGGVVVADFTWLVATSPSSPLAPPSLWWLRGYLGFLATGMLLAVLAARSRTGRRPAIVDLVGRHPWWCWGAALVAFAVSNTPAVGSIASAVLTKEEAALKYACQLVVAAGLAAPVVLARGGGPERLLARPVPVWLGRNSCGTFLWHLVVMQVTVWYLFDSDWAQLGTGAFFALLPFVMGLSVLAGWLSYTFVEAPLLRRFRIRSHRPAPEPEAEPDRAVKVPV